MSRNIQSGQDALQQELLSLPIKRRALAELKINGHKLSTEILNVEAILKAAETASASSFEKSNQDSAASYTKMLESLPERLCGICMDCNLNSPAASYTKLGCPCQIIVCTPCFSLMITEIHKNPLNTNDKNLSCFSCQCPVPALKLAHTSFLTAVSNSPLLLKAHVKILKQEMIEADRTVAISLEEEEMDEASFARYEADQVAEIREQGNQREERQNSQLQNYLALPESEESGNEGDFQNNIRLPESESEDTIEEQETLSEERERVERYDPALFEIENDAAARNANATPRASYSVTLTENTELTLEEMLDLLDKESPYASQE